MHSNNGIKLRLKWLFILSLILPDVLPKSAFPILRSEGHHIRSESIEDTLKLVVDDLYTVYRVPEDAFETEAWPVGAYGLVFTQDVDKPLTIITVHVKDGHIVGLDYNYGKHAASIIEQKVGELLLPRTNGGRG